MIGRILAGPALALALAALLSGNAAAQGLTGPIQGLAVDSDAPIHIESDSLEIDEARSIATFIGTVRANQDEMLLTTDRLLVNYLGANGGEPARLRTIQAQGSVVVRVNDQIATGDTANYDLAKEEVSLTGNVVLSQGENVIKGETIIVDLRTSRARVISSTAQGGDRVRMVVTPNRNQ